jgi:hypothetical protein
LLLAGLALHPRHVPKRKYDSQSGEDQTRRPIKDERHFSQGLPQHRLAEQEHQHGDYQKSQAAFAMLEDAIIAVHAFKIASKLLPTEKFLAGISRSAGRKRSGRSGRTCYPSGDWRAFMQITKQLAIFLDNRPGTLARVADALAQAKINIYAISTSDTVDHSVIRLVVDDYRRALHLFEEHGTLVVEDDVIMTEGDNRPGSLARIAHKLADAKVNIEYAYCATPPDAKKGLLILRVGDAKKALKVLNS